MNYRTLKLLVIHELRMLVRDRRTLVMALFLPTVLMPIMIFGSRIAQERRNARLEEEIYSYAIVGSYAEELRQQIRVAEKAREGDAHPFRSVEIPTKNAESDLRDNRLQFYVLALRPEDAPESDRPTPTNGRRSSRDNASEVHDGFLATSDHRPEEVPLVRVVYRGDRDRSQTGSQKMRELLASARDAAIREALSVKGFAGDPAAVYRAESLSVASAAEATGSSVGRLLTLFMVLFMLAGGSVAAMDIIAGEKERGTLETLLTTAGGRAEIAAGKQLAILAVALSITLLQVLNFVLYLKLQIFPLPESFVIDITPGAIVILALLFIPLAAAAASVLLIISAYSRTYKEAQLYFFPVYLASMFPALAAALPGMTLRSPIVLLPVANVSVAVFEVLSGRPDLPMIAVTFLVMTATALLLVRTSARLLVREDRIVSNPESVLRPGGLQAFRRHVWVWFAITWAVIFTVAANIPWLQDIRRQILFNQVVAFLGCVALAIWYYGLPWKEALAVRRPNRWIWPLVLILIPSGHVTSLVVFRLANLAFPAPVQLLERMSQQLVPQDLAAWQLYLLIAILPGICEELAFRGLLLYGLRERFRPWMLPIAVGAVFGMFHFALFRIIPTAFLGMALTVLCMYTRSIFPGMVLHAGNNALALWLSRIQFPLDQIGWEVAALSVGIFVLTFYGVYRVGRLPSPTASRSPLSR